MNGSTLGGRLTRNLSASLFAKASSSIYRIAMIPLFIWFLGANRYGEWLLVSSIPSWLALSNLSLGSVSANAITLHTARGDHREARGIYSTTIVALAIFSAGGLIIASILLWIVYSGTLAPPKPLVTVASSTLLAIGLLSLSVFVGFFAEPFSARLRAAGRADVAIKVGGAMPWIEAGCYMPVLFWHADFVNLAAATLVSRCLFVTLNWWISRKAHSELYFSPTNVRISLIAPLLSKGLAYQALPLGHALSNQAMLMVVGAAIDPIAVAVFGTARTMVRLGTQAMELINFAVWPEMSLLLGAGKYQQAAVVHRAASACTISTGIGTAIIAVAAGPWIFDIWTLHELSVTHALMAIFGLSMLLQSLWHASLIVQLAANEHEGVAIRYAFGAFVSVLLCYPLSRIWGIYGAACSTLIIDAVLIPYSITKSLDVTHDTFAEFTRGLVPALRAGLARARSHLAAS